MLRALTLRGWGFLCAGAGVTAGGWAIGERDLVGMGVLAMALPVVSALPLLAVVGARRGITHSRSLRPARVTAGTATEVRLRLTNRARVLPAGGVTVEDALPAGMGERPRFHIGLVGPNGARELAYRLPAPVRGSHRIGPLRLWRTDPLGLVRIRQRDVAHTSLLVTPRVVPLRGGPRGAGGAGAVGGGAAVRPVGADDEDDAIPREYRHGDDLRRVHWRSTARHGELMVRREEQHQGDRSTVLLDTRAGAHSGPGASEAAGSLETAVSVAASVASHLLGRRQRVRLLTPEREVNDAVGGPAGPDGASVVDALAVERASRAASLLDSVGSVTPLAGAPAAGSGMLVAVVGALRPDETGALAGMFGTAGHRGGGAYVAVLCRGAAWPSPDARELAGAALSRAGWRVLDIGSPGELPAAWRRMVEGTAA